MEEYTAAVDPKVLQQMYDLATSDPIWLLVHGSEEQPVLQKLQVGAESILGQAHIRSGCPTLHLEFGEESDEPLERTNASQTLGRHRLAEAGDGTKIYASLLQTYWAAA